MMQPHFLSAIHHRSFWRPD